MRVAQSRHNKATIVRVDTNMCISSAFLVFACQGKIVSPKYFPLLWARVEEYLLIYPFPFAIFWFNDCVDETSSTTFWLVDDPYLPDHGV